jgi:N-formylmaleamate deformylase
MPRWSDGYVKSNGLRIHYYRTGGDKPKVIFNHGAGDDGLCWTHVVKELENDYDAILLDARGHGKSSSGKGDYSSAQRVEDLAGVIQALGLDRPVVGGHSMGADTAMNLAAVHPDMTRGIFLEDPPIVLPGEKWEMPDEQMQNMSMEDMGKMMQRFMLMFKLMPRFIAIRQASKFNPTYPQDELVPWLESKDRLSFDFLRSMSSMNMMARDPFEVFKKITVPVLLLIGDKKRMSIVSKECAGKVCSLNSQVRVVQLEGADHNIRRTRFDGYMPALQEFLGDIYLS